MLGRGLGERCAIGSTLLVASAKQGANNFLRNIGALNPIEALRDHFTRGAPMSRFVRFQHQVSTPYFVTDRCFQGRFRLRPLDGLEPAREDGICYRHSGQGMNVGRRPMKSIKLGGPGAWVLAAVIWVAGCAGGETVDPVDHMGMAGAMIGGCMVDLDCGLGLACDRATGQCVQSTPEMGGNTGGSVDSPACSVDADCPPGQWCPAAVRLCRPIDTGGGGGRIGGGAGGRMNAGGARPAPVSNACDNGADLDAMDEGATCLATCAETRAAAEERCQLTPSRIIDCVADAAIAEEECQTQCPSLRNYMRQCAARCQNDGARVQCAGECVRDAMGISQSCSECFGPFLDCAVDQCWRLCASGFERADCEMCTAEHCDAAFESCSGVSIVR